MNESIIFIESKGEKNAISSAGAIGLMQLTPSSASDIIFLENKKLKGHFYPHVNYKRDILPLWK